MTITLYELRQGLLDSDYDPYRSKGQVKFPTTTSSLGAAVRLYHTEGLEAAQKQLNIGLSGYFAQQGSPTGKARTAHKNFDRYVALAERDDREVFGTNVRMNISIHQHEFSVQADVLLLDPDGYVGRVLLWGADASSLTLTQLELLATPVILALREELGHDRIVGIDMWQIRSERIVTISAEQADANLGQLVSMLNRWSGP
jgi:hypothetical protein